MALASMMTYGRAGSRGCERCVREPGDLSLNFRTPIRDAARRLAREDGVSLNQGISSAGSRKVGSVEVAAAFFKQRAGGADGAAMMRFLEGAPDLPEESSGKGTGR